MRQSNNLPCSVCHQVPHKTILTVGRYTLFRCRSCDLYHLTPITPDVGADYKSVLDLEIYISYMRDFHAKQYRQELKDIIQLKPAGKVLDVGCGAGWFLSEARKFGYQTTGLEVQKSLVDIARRENRHSRIIHGSLDKLSSQKGKFDVISFWSVIEHLPDPPAALRISHKLLSKNGILAIRTPNSQGLIQRLSILLFKLSGGSIKFPLVLILQLEFQSKHWFLFSKSNLKLLLANCGFEVKAVKYSTSMDWKDLDSWLLARKRKTNFIVRKIYFLAFAVNALVTTITNTQDDLVVLAEKK